jgi:peroxiredoxin
MKNIIKIICLNIIGIIIPICGYSQNNSSSQENEIPADYGYVVNIGDDVPEITMEQIDGKKVSSGEWNGKIVMLQFTASWCSVCRKEMPYIEEKIWQKHKDNPNFILIGIDYKEPLKEVRKFAKRIEITYPLALDPEAEIFEKFAAKKAGVTRNVIIDKNGKIAYMTRLFKMEEFNEMTRVIDTLLEEL